MASNDPISQVSHQLRTPLTVIMSTVNNLLDGAFGKLNDEQIKWIKKMEHHTAHLETLLSEILALMKQQLENGGVIHVPEEKGSFHPAPMAGSPGAKTKSISPFSGVTACILAVDDEQDVLDVIQEGLRMKGFETITASNGEDAIRLAVEHHPDLILMDVLLKTQNGMEICHEIKKKLSSFTPVIMITGQDDLREKVSGFVNEADDLLTKPFQIEELYSRVNSMLKIKHLTDELAQRNNGAKS